MKKKETLLKELRLFEVFVSRCLLRTKGFQNDCRDFISSFGDHTNSMSLALAIQTAQKIKNTPPEDVGEFLIEDWPDQYKKTKKLILKPIFAFALQIKDKYDQFVSKWGCPSPMLLTDIAVWDKALSNGKILNFKNDRPAYLVDLSPIKLYSQKLEKTSYLPLATDFTYTVSELRDWFDMINKSTHSIMRKTLKQASVSYYFRSRLKRRLLAYLKDSRFKFTIQGVNELIRCFDASFKDDGSRIGRFKAALNTPEIHETPLEFRTIHKGNIEVVPIKELDKVGKKIDRRVSLVEDCIINVIKILRPPDTFVKID